MNCKIRKHMRCTLKETFFCDENGSYVSVEQITNPTYEPWIRCTVGLEDENLEEKRTGITWATFYYHVKTNRLFREHRLRLGPFWDRLKSNKLIWKKLIGEILEQEPKVYDKWLERRTFLDTGYVYTPYIPLLKTPSVLESNEFSIKSLISTRYTTKLINPSS